MIEGIHIECDEDGFRLVFDGGLEDGIRRYLNATDMGMMNLRLSQTAAVQLLTSVQETIGPWHAEGEAVRQEFESRRSQSDPRDGYAADDPKHPDYLERADVIADRERERGWQS